MKQSGGWDAYETHAHTRFKVYKGMPQGSDGAHSVEEMMKTAKERGLRGIIITDHNSINGFKETAKLADFYGLYTIPAVEVSTKDGHMLAYFKSDVNIGAVNQKLLRGSRKKGAQATIGVIHELKGAAVVPHPYCTAYDLFKNPIYKAAIRKLDGPAGLGGLVRRLEGLQGIEEYNIPAGPASDCPGEAARLGVAPMAGSDTHTKHSIGYVVTMFPKVGHPDELVDCIYEGRTKGVLLARGQKARSVDKIRRRNARWLLGFGRFTAHSIRKSGF